MDTESGLNHSAVIQELEKLTTTYGYPCWVDKIQRKLFKGHDMQVWTKIMKCHVDAISLSSSIGQKEKWNIKAAN